jgi:hypothetical protein
MEAANSKFKVGDLVLVAIENPNGNPRTPKYIRGKRGVVGLVHGPKGRRANPNQYL